MEREHDEADGCKVDGCFEEAFKNGRCSKHQQDRSILGGFYDEQQDALYNIAYGD
jgi:hypothetical protein